MRTDKSGAVPGNRGSEHKLRDRGQGCIKVKVNQPRFEGRWAKSLGRKVGKRDLLQCG